MPLTPVLSKQQAKGKSPLQKAALAMDLAENIGALAMKTSAVKNAQAPMQSSPGNQYGGGTQPLGIMPDEEIRKALTAGWNMKSGVKVGR